MIRALLRQARHELGILRLLGECTLVPLALFLAFAVPAALGETLW